MNDYATCEISSLDEIEIENAIVEAIEVCEELQAARIDTSTPKENHYRYTNGD
ncbi:MAG: hypothetical protein IPO08_20465 [Xanthomonadales bacterium]|nr:hypothetical protein [Xanthomonadales bacterium]